ncbi:MAG: hypothetical protein IKW00_08905 [Clostridia bacterium]|nr:hypothetical protein [Clostridia bacterium]
MNLRRRTLKTVYISRPSAKQGSFGGIGWAYEPSHQTVMGCLQPQGGQISDVKSGMIAQEKMTLLLPLSCDIKPGDGVGFAKDQCIFRATHCARYPLHVCALLERLLP